MRYILVAISLACSLVSSAQQKGHYEYLFTELLKEAPEILNMDMLKSYPKFRNIHHDSFDRLSEIPIDDSGEELDYYTTANGRDIGKNSYQNSDKYAYQVLNSYGVNFSVGVKKQNDGYVAYNQVNCKKRQVSLLMINTQTKDYGILVKRGTTTKADAKVAFKIVDIDNFYYARLTDRKLFLYQVYDGRIRRIKTFKTRGERTLYLLLAEDCVYFYADWKYKGVYNMTSNGSTLCGLMFRGNELSEVDDIIVEQLDDWGDNNMDAVIETGEISPKKLGAWQADDGLITASMKYTNKSKYSIRFELEYHEQWDSHKNVDRRRTEICPRPKKSAPLDSWISSFDIFFPGQNDGDEYYQIDALPELFWQSHDKDAAYGLPPHVAMYLQNDIITFQTQMRSLLRYDKKMVSSNETYKLDGRIGKLVDVLTDSDIDLELKRGEWHNFTIYVKEGYTESQLPRSIVYVDGKKVIDWFHPNAYNCGQNAEYLKMGIYKWPWAKDNLKIDVRKRVLYYDNIIYLR